MPLHDYLVYGNLNEIDNFANNIKTLRQLLKQVEDLISTYEGKNIDSVMKPLNIIKDNVVKVESLTRELLPIPDPQKIEAGKLIKEMDARTDWVRVKLERLIQAIASEKGSKISRPVHVTCPLLYFL